MLIAANSNETNLTEAKITYEKKLAINAQRKNLRLLFLNGEITEKQFITQINKLEDQENTLRWIGVKNRGSYHSL